MENKKISKNVKAVLDKDLLVKFLILKHFEQTSTDISRIKLQKSLYFLFAIWSGFSYNEEKEKNNELEDFYVNTYLYKKAKFEAWKYGPVDKEVYNSHLNGIFSKKEEIKKWNINDIEDKLFKDDKYGQTKSFIKNIITSIFKMSEFDLAERSHLDKAWKNSFENNNDKEIKLDDIRKEYTKKMES